MNISNKNPTLRKNPETEMLLREEFLQKND